MFTRKTSPILPILLVGMALLLTGCTAQQWQQWDAYAADSNTMNQMPIEDAPSSSYTRHNMWAAPSHHTNLESSSIRYSDRSPAEAIQQQLAHLQALESQTTPNRETGMPADVHIPAVQSTPALPEVNQEIQDSPRNTATTLSREQATSAMPNPHRILSFATEEEAVTFGNSEKDANLINQSSGSLHEQIQKLGQLSNVDKNTLRSACSLKCTERLIDVSGVGTVSIPTTQAAVRATIEVRSDTGDATARQITPAEAAAGIESNQRTLSAKTKSVLDFLQSTALAPFITKLATANIQLQPIYTYKDGTQILKGYRSTVTITFQVDLEHAPVALSGIVQNGVTNIESVSFVPSDEALSAARVEAIRRAGEDALTQANASILGVGETTPLTPLQIVSLNVIGVTQPGAEPMGNYMNLETAHMEVLPLMAAAPIAVIGDEKLVRATVVAKIRF